VFSLEGTRAVAALALLTAVAGGAGFASEEGVSFGTGVYWAITTMTTVGYGDITPTSTEGKVLAVIVMLVGIGTATLLIGAVAQRLLTPAVEHVESTEDDVLDEPREIAMRLSRLERRLQNQRRARPAECSCAPPRGSQCSTALRSSASGAAGAMNSYATRSLPDSYPFLR
jgi:voltage-gated potassium channel